MQEEKQRATNNEIGAAWMIYALNTLREGWPKPVSLDPEVAIGETGVQAQDDTASLNLWSGLMTWLRDEGVIRIGALMNSGTCLQVTLTAKGYAALGQSSPIDPKFTVGDKIKKAGVELATGATKEGGKFVGKEAGEAVAEFVGSLAGSLIKSLGSG